MYGVERIELRDEPPHGFVLAGRDGNRWRQARFGNRAATVLALHHQRRDPADDGQGDDGAEDGRQRRLSVPDASGRADRSGMGNLDELAFDLFAIIVHLFPGQGAFDAFATSDRAQGAPALR